MKRIMLNIYYEDEDVIVCHKPAGIATQTARLGEADMESELRNHLADQGQKPWIGVVHRLDQPVEGIMVFAKHPQAAASLSAQIREHGIGKHYYALTTQIPEQKEGTLVHYLRFDRKGNRSEAFEQKIPDGKRAELSYRVLGEADGRWLWEIDLKTGRHHQIRAQLSAIGCPLIGDRKYGNLPSDAKSGSGMPGLCSYALEFTHPKTGERLSFHATPTGEAFFAFRGFLTTS